MGTGRFLRNLADYYGSRTLHVLQEFNAVYENKHLTSNLCSAKNDDPAGRTTCLVEEAQATLDADAQDHGEMDSAQSRKGRRREWAHRANLAKWHVESAAKWITCTSYATQLSPT